MLHLLDSVSVQVTSYESGKGCGSCVAIVELINEGWSAI
ncbi:hypothetical protein TcasGA2_TC031353 [Tribolium castaneum]|uniref:Uncharacterized protein n=1 Tax=Tribolium castaneum TaxID=7070 RepID=A0A139WB33_TRICA|nr:hypothetical protein TcasGA2_TC031353 [Tribolium castaneum]